jgi:hypothetical protein
MRNRGDYAPKIGPNVLLLWLLGKARLEVGAVSLAGLIEFTEFGLCNLPVFVALDYFVVLLYFFIQLETFPFIRFARLPSVFRTYSQRVYAASSADRTTTGPRNLMAFVAGEAAAPPPRFWLPPPP